MLLPCGQSHMYLGILVPFLRESSPSLILHVKFLLAVGKLQTSSYNQTFSMHFSALLTFVFCAFSLCVQADLTTYLGDLPPCGVRSLLSRELSYKRLN